MEFEVIGKVLKTDEFGVYGIEAHDNFSTELVELKMEVFELLARQSCAVLCEEIGDDFDKVVDYEEFDVERTFKFDINLKKSEVNLLGVDEMTTTEAWQCSVLCSSISDELERQLKEGDE